MTWYSRRYDNKRTLNIMIEVAFDDPDNTSLFLSSSDIQLLSVKFDQQALLSFRPVFSFSFFYFFFIYVYIYNFFILSLWSWWHISLCWFHYIQCSRDNATCTNTEGFFNCSCDPGFSGDEHNCAGVRIFQSMIAFSFQQVKHTWPDLFVHKYFKRALPCFISSMTQHLRNLIKTCVSQFFFDWLSCLYCNFCIVYWSLLTFTRLGTISWSHCRHRWMRYRYPQLQQGQCDLYKYQGIVQLLL